MAESTGSDSAPDANVELQELCQLLVGMDRERLYAAIQRLENRHEFAEHLSTVLSEAMRLSMSRDARIGETLAPIVSRGVHETVKRDPKTFGKALAPAMGPAIRQAVMQMFRGLVETFERTLEHSFSAQGWKWRLEAWRTGKTFTEVVFLHTLAYRVEHVFLIHRHTGLQLQHVSARDLGTRDPDLISAMLTAIQDFVGDAFDSPDGDRLDTFRVGELTVWIEHTDRAILAAVIRGQPLARIRMDFRASLENIDQGFAKRLDSFDGDTDLFEAALPELEACLLEKQLEPKGERSKNRLGLWILVVLVLGLVTWLVFWWITDHRDASRFAAYVQMLRDEPGLVVTDADRSGGRYRVSGLRDPLAVDPLQFALTNGIERSRVDGSWSPYQALDPQMILKRAEIRLRPPSGVTLAFDGGVLRATGTADSAWAQTLLRIGPLLAGVDSVDAEHLEQK